mmetsp:Transcript_11255/g.15503  ORF Transcript_11255/g.15503 Transcript_11255/m.15503 type:complete len:414 (+) Transcript_11255:68-1309(+)
MSDAYGISTNRFCYDSTSMKPSVESSRSSMDFHSNSQVEGTAFPHKLHSMLEIESARMETCALGSVQWEKHGFTFRILDANRFETETIPKYFKHTKYTSFQRQLNLYGFRRLSKGEDQGSYFHPKFQRNRKDLLYEIRRLPVKSSSTSSDAMKKPTASTSSFPTDANTRKDNNNTPTLIKNSSKQQAQQTSTIYNPKEVPSAVSANSIAWQDSDELYDFDPFSANDSAALDGLTEDSNDQNPIDHTFSMIEPAKGGNSTSPSSSLVRNFGDSNSSMHETKSASDLSAMVTMKEASNCNESRLDTLEEPCAFDVEEHLAKFDKQEFMDLIFSCVRDLEGGEEWLQQQQKQQQQQLLQQQKQQSSVKPLTTHTRSSSHSSLSIQSQPQIYHPQAQETDDKNVVNSTTTQPTYMAT